MQVIKKSSQGMQCLPLDAMLLAQRIVFLNEEIDARSVLLVFQQLLYLENEDEHTPVTMIIDSPGGKVDAGLKLYDQMKGMHIPIITYCTGMAASTAAIILAGGTKGHLFILPHSKVMIHEPFLLSSWVPERLNMHEAQKCANAAAASRTIFVELLAQDCARSKQEVEEAMSDDRYMTAEEAVAFGICDAVVERVSI